MMPNADLARREKPCQTCGGSETVFDGWQFVTCPDCTNGLVPAESAEEYAARLVALVEQARRERDWLLDAIDKRENLCLIDDIAVGCIHDCRRCHANRARDMAAVWFARLEG